MLLFVVRVPVPVAAARLLRAEDDPALQGLLQRVHQGLRERLAGGVEVRHKESKGCVNEIN